MTIPDFIALVFPLAAAGIAGAAAPAPVQNTLQIVIGGGPNAGTYKPPPAGIICLHVPKQRTFAATYKDFDAHGSGMLSEAGINVSNPDEAGAKRGEVRISFAGPNGKPPVLYEVFVPQDSVGPITLTRSGKSAELAFEGQTKSGIHLRVTASCMDISEF